MRIHTDLTLREFIECLSEAGVGYHRLTEHGSRSRARAFDVILEGTSSRRPNGHAYDGCAATWDEWGAFFAAVYRADPNMVCSTYQSSDHFHWVTGGRYRDGIPQDSHQQHKWEWQGTVATGAYSVLNCAKCSAILRRGDWKKVGA